MSIHNNLERRRYTRVNCSGQSDLLMGQKVIHAQLVNVSMSGFSVLADQKTKLYHLYEGVLSIHRATGPILFRACSVGVEGKKGNRTASRFKISFSFIELDSFSKEKLVSYIKSTISKSGTTA